MKCFDFSFTPFALAATAAWGLLAAAPTMAAQDFWKAAESGGWDTPSRWLDGSVPSSADLAAFNLSGTYLVTFGGDPAAIQALTVSNAANVTFGPTTSAPLPVTLRVNSGGTREVILSGGAALSLGRQLGLPFQLAAGDEITMRTGATLNVNFASQVVSPGIFVGHEGQGSLNINDGRVQSNFGGVGFGHLGDGDAVVSGSGSLWDISGHLVVGTGSNSGNTAVGTLSITGGAQVQNSQDAVIGTFGGDGTVTVSGVGSLWNTGRLFIGRGNSVDTDPGPGTLNIQPGGTVRVSGDTEIFSQGRLRLQGGIFDTGALHAGLFEWTSGTYRVGTHHGPLLNQSGTLAPGHSAGSTTVLGNYEQRASGILEIEIGGVAQGTQYDVVNVADDALLGGRLDLKLIDGFMPTPGQNFIIMSSETVSGAFNNAANGQRLTTVDGGGSFLVHYGPSSAFDPALVVLSGFQSGGRAGDFDGDGDVDGRDFLVWQRGGSPTPNSSGDLAAWQANFGSGGVVAASRSIPEPSGAWLAIVAISLTRCGSTLRRRG